MFHKEPAFQPLAYGLVAKAERGVCYGNGECGIEILVPPIKNAIFFGFCLKFQNLFRL